MSFYSCPIESEAFTLCDGCPFSTHENGKMWCHAASPNYLYPDTAGDILPLIYPEKVGKAETRIVTINGEKRMQINEKDLDKIGYSSQVPVKKLKAAWDAAPQKQATIRRAKRNR